MRALPPIVIGQDIHHKSFVFLELSCSSDRLTDTHTIHTLILHPQGSIILKPLVNNAKAGSLERTSGRSLLTIESDIKEDKCEDKCEEK